MFKLIRFLKNVYRLGRRLKAEELRQASEGYSIRYEQFGPEGCTTYCEEEREACIIVDFNFYNDVVVYSDSFRKWQKPYGELLSELDFVKVKNRAIRYFECWGEVSMDDRRLPTNEDFKKQLETDGIPYEEVGDGIITYKIDIESERKRKGRFFDR